MKPKLSKGVIFVLAIVALLVARWFFFRAPSESQMIASFHAHKAEFEQIRLMMAADDLSAVGPDSASAQPRQVPPGGGVTGLELMPLNVSESRLALYRSRLKTLGLYSVSADNLKNRVRFIQFGGGFTDTVWHIGYMWCKDTPKPLVKSAYHQMPGQNNTHFSRIEGNWYIYHSH